MTLNEKIHHTQSFMTKKNQISWINVCIKKKNNLAVYGLYKKWLTTRKWENALNENTIHKSTQKMNVFLYTYAFL